jgi:hypothetical protein
VCKPVGGLTYADICPVFSMELPSVVLLTFTVEGRLGSPMISIVCVAVPENGFMRATRNSPDGGGAVWRGIVLVSVAWRGVLKS